MIINKITIIGTGNVAHVLGKLFLANGINIVEVYGRCINKATALANILQATPNTNLATLSNQTHLFLVCIKDTALPQFALNFTPTNIPIVHTAGSVAMQVLKPASKNIGVFYPLQSLLSNMELIPQIPFLITANNTILEHALLNLAAAIKSNAQIINCENRQAMHLAAVFSNNFTNYMYYCAQQLCNTHQVNFAMLQPLITETANRLLHHLPSTLQTGPALRGDAATQKKHITMLSPNTLLQRVYRNISNAIFTSLSNK